jgi:hypothetical protein
MTAKPAYVADHRPHVDLYVCSTCRTRLKEDSPEVVEGPRHGPCRDRLPGRGTMNLTGVYSAAMADRLEGTTARQPPKVDPEDPSYGAPRVGRPPRKLKPLKKRGRKAPKGKRTKRRKR